MTASRKPARRIRKRPTMTEAQLHKAVADYLAVALPTEGCVWTTFPAGGGGKVRGAQLKGRGLRAGWPDIQIVWELGPAHHSGCGVVCIELKTEVGALSAAQRSCHEAIYSAGGDVYVCRSVDDVHAALSRHSIPLRAKPFGLGTERSAA